MIAPQVEIVTDEGLVVAKLSKDIDLANVGQISARVVDAIPNDAVGLIIDLSAVRYIDSAGIQMLIRLVRRLRACRQEVAISVQEGSPVRTLLKITNLDAMVRTFPSQEQCAAALRGDGASTY